MTGGRAESPEEVAEEFNKYFSSVFSSEDLENMPEVEGGRAGGVSCWTWLCRERRFAVCWGC